MTQAPKLLTLVRVTFLVGSTAIHPILGIITLLTDTILKMHISRKQTDKIIKAYQDEISRVKTKIDKAKDGNSKDRLTKYKDELKKDLEKIKDYARELYSDEENDERDMNDMSSYDYDDDFDFGDDDLFPFVPGGVHHLGDIFHMGNPFGDTINTHLFGVLCHLL